MRFQKILNPAFAENFKRIGRKSKKAQPNELIGLFVYFPKQNIFCKNNLLIKAEKFRIWDGHFAYPATMLGTSKFKLVLMII